MAHVGPMPVSRRYTAFLATAANTAGTTLQPPSQLLQLGAENHRFCQNRDSSDSSYVRDNEAALFYKLAESFRRKKLDMAVVPQRMHVIVEFAEQRYRQVFQIPMIGC